MVFYQCKEQFVIGHLWEWCTLSFCSWSFGRVQLVVTNSQHKPLSCSSARQEQYVAAEVMVIPASAWLERQNVRLQRRWAGLETSSWEGNGEFMGPWPEQNSSIVYCIWYDMVILCCMIWGMGHDMMLYGCYTIKVSPMLRRASDPDEPISRSPAYHFTIWCTSF